MTRFADVRANNGDNNILITLLILVFILLHVQLGSSCVVAFCHRIYDYVYVYLHIFKRTRY